ncbi:MAG: hypothetical protein MUP58_02860 [Candidatus Nanohaloarchaeota archaeon QJJ-9]|nr:hypothetical protein [Candidatus Nanohaloarchaeota archaeon QJJ-9]
MGEKNEVDYSRPAEILEDKTFDDISTDKREKVIEVYEEAKKKGGLFDQFMDVVRTAYKQNKDPEVGENRLYAAGQFSPVTRGNLSELDRRVAHLKDFMEDYEISYRGKSADFDRYYIQIKTGDGTLGFHPFRSDNSTKPDRVKNKGFDPEEIAEMLDKLSEVVKYREHYLAEYEMLMMHAAGRDRNKYKPSPEE